MTTNHYVTNKDFLRAIVEYNQTVKQAAKEGKPKPQLTNYIAECLWLIAKNLANKPSFNQYTFKEEMIGDAVENCLRYFHNFNAEKYKNPFAYFTQISKFAFIRRITKEKKELYIKYKSAQHSLTMGDGNVTQSANDDGDDGSVKHFELYDNIQEFIATYEDSQRKRKEKEKSMSRSGLENFMEEEQLDEGSPLPDLEDTLEFIDVEADETIEELTIERE